MRLKSRGFVFYKLIQCIEITQHINMIKILLLTLGFHLCFSLPIILEAYYFTNVESITTEAEEYYLNTEYYDVDSEYYPISSEDYVIKSEDDTIDSEDYPINADYSITKPGKLLCSGLECLDGTEVILFFNI